MVQTVIMPKLGQTVEESTLVKWRKCAGEVVAKGEILFEIETDKAVLEIESFFEGTLLKIIVAEGETVPVMAPVAFIGSPGEPIPEVKPAPALRSALAKEGLPAIAPGATAGPSSPLCPSGFAGQAAARSPTVAKPSAAIVPAAPVLRSALAKEDPSSLLRPSGFAGQAVVCRPSSVPISPRARRLLRESAISAERITGTGPGGRIIEKDVQAYLEAQRYAELKITPAALALARENGIDILTVPRAAAQERITVEMIHQAIAEKPKPLSKMRQVIAQRLTASFTSTPHFYVTVAVDMTDLLAWRGKLKKEERPSVTAFILKAVALALKEWPALNSSTDGRTARWHSRVHLGLAVALKEGLVVPVIRDAEDLPLAELNARADNLAAKAREGKLTPAEMTGSTFTVTNMGMLDVDHFTGIINPGESAILAVASTRPTPVARAGMIEIRSMMNMTLSADHRLVDGACAAGFVNRVKSILQDLELWKSMI
ncbi:MAG: 2-oxo acid dehydrogenase subunit E2 [Lentisphaerae bacterium]|nr:2-oxo acid dehydrogenase subunit E2 [Lentisphaerota bacterium]